MFLQPGMIPRPGMASRSYGSIGAPAPSSRPLGAARGSVGAVGIGARASAAPSVRPSLSKPPLPKHPPSSSGGLKRKLDEALRRSLGGDRGGPEAADGEPPAQRPKVGAKASSWRVAFTSRAGLLGSKSLPKASAAASDGATTRPSASAPGSGIGSSRGPHPPNTPPPGAADKFRLTKPAPKKAIDKAETPRPQPASGAGGSSSSTATFKPLMSASKAPPPKGASAAGSSSATQRGAGASGAVSATAEANKQIMKMKKIEVLCKQLLDELLSLNEAKKEEAILSVSSRFCERLPETLLDMMRDKLVFGSFVGEGDSPKNGDTNGLFAPATKQAQEPDVEADADPDPDADYEAAGGGAAAPSAPAPSAAASSSARASALSQATKALLAELPGKADDELCEAWFDIVPSPSDQTAGFTAFFEAAMNGEGGDEGAEQATRVALELVKSKRLANVKPIEDALQALSSKIEGLTQSREHAWHLHSRVLTAFFPKTSSTTWGLLRTGWNWTTWWKMATAALSEADQFRSFDIFVMILQTLQERTGVSIKDQQVWKEGGRNAKMRQLLGQWGEMEESAVVDTLHAYGVKV